MFTFLRQIFFSLSFSSSLSLPNRFEERTCLEWLEADSLRASDPRYATPSRFDDSRITSFKTIMRNDAFLDAFQAGQVDSFSAVKIHNSCTNNCSNDCYAILKRKPVFSRNRENLFLNGITKLLLPFALSRANVF